jgi:GNAT superfamily N-acetyltransferase
MKLAFRPAVREDRAFIIPTWSASYKKSRYAGLITSEDWADVMHRQLGKILDRAGARAIVAYDRQDPDYFYGWIAGDTSEPTPVVYYVYTKEPYRRAGIARGLFAALGVDPTRYFVYVCSPVNDSQELIRKLPSARFNTLEVRYPKEQRRRPL